MLPVEALAGAERPVALPGLVLSPQRPPERWMARTAQQALGLLVAGTGFQVPTLILEPIHLIGGAAIPAMLMAFGMSLNGSRPLQKSAGRRLDTLLASGFKLVVHPLVAYLFARFALGMDGHALFAVVVTAALPTAQNVFVAANRYQAGITVAKDTVLITTIVAVPAMIAVALLLT